MSATTDRFAQLPPPPPGKTGWPWLPSPEEAAHCALSPEEAQRLPSIAIITPSYGQGHFIEETIRSILLQGYPKLRYYVLDGGSQDATVEVLKKYDAFIDYWHSEKDAGQSDAINQGMRKVWADGESEVVNWLNSDDYLLPGALRAIGRAFAAHPETHCVLGRGRIFGKGLPTRISRGTDIHPTLAETMGRARIDQPQTWFRVAATKQMGLLQQGLFYVMDVDWWLRYLLLYGLDHHTRIDDLLVNFRLHEVAKTQAGPEKMVQERDQVHRALAQAAGVFAFEATFRDVLQTPERKDSYAFSMPEAAQHQNEVRAALNYFFLHKAMECYEAYDRTHAELCFVALEPQLLDEAAQARLNTYRWRNTWLPSPLRRLIRRVRG